MRIYEILNNYLYGMSCVNNKKPLLCFRNTSAPEEKKHTSFLNELARGDLPIRQQYGYKITETELLPSTRMGLCDGPLRRDQFLKLPEHRKYQD